MLAVIQTAQDSLNSIAEVRALVGDIIKLRESMTHDTTFIRGVPDAVTTFILTAIGAALVRFLEKTGDKIIAKINETKKP